MFVGDGQCIFGADIGLVAGVTGADHIDGVRGFLLNGGEQQVQVIDGKSGQIIKGQQRFGVQNLLDQNRFAGGDLTFAGSLGKLSRLFCRDGLGQHGALHCILLQKLCDFLGQTLAECFSAGGVIVFHRNQDRIGQLINITMAQH